jgi:hypothetical protein
MESKYGYSLDDWEKAKVEVRTILIERARNRSQISYSELVGKVSAIHLDPESYALAHLLGEVSTESDAAGGGMLTVLVVHKHGDQMPGQGFFELAKKLGRDTSDPDKFWVEELNRVYARWAGS